MTDYDATYSPEDNKLRLTASEWLDDDEYKRLKDAGFRWAPKQEVFYVSWSPNREDICIDLAGEIEPEGTTLADRAADRAARFDGYQSNRHRAADSYHRAADAISERFAFGQPILVGHHSERSARRDQKRMQSAMDNAVRASETANYWAYRAEGVERHANQHHSARTRANRIKKLLADMRDYQRSINKAWRNLVLWEKIAKKADADNFQAVVEVYAGGHDTAPWNIYIDGEKYSPWSDLRDGKITPMQVVNACLEHYQWLTENPYYLRCVQHILNRLAYEREEQLAQERELTEITAEEQQKRGRFEGELTPVILQAFAREQGAEKPKATKNELMGTYTLASLTPLPLQIDPAGDMQSGGNLELKEADWRDLMQSCGHTVVVKEKRAGKAQACPLINPNPVQAQVLQDLWNAEYQDASKHGQVREMEQKYYSANSGGDYGMFFTLTLDQYGKRIFRSGKGDQIPTCRVRASSGNGFCGAYAVILVSDKPQKDLPNFVKAIKEAA